MEVHGDIISMITLPFASVMLSLGNLDCYDKCLACLGYATVSLTFPHGTNKAKMNKEILLDKT